ncbi:MAG: gfo/Idh/MocA family oxidoreductase, partial [Clostridiales bacterium]|nr:gfo/Idh/MocA family oxidoreductase [Clostridiales bacterium]
RAELGGKQFAQGDVVTTMLKCENGETVLIKLDTTLPRLYDRELTVSGTKGFYNQTTNSVVLDNGAFNHDTAAYKEAFGSQENYNGYLPGVWKDITEEQIAAGHGGMDYIMLKYFFEAVRNREEMPIDVYDAAVWMSVTALSAQSIADGSHPVEIPDFTRGAYKSRARKDVVSLLKK